MQPPAVGRIVHYVLPEGTRHAGQHRAAIVAQVHGGAPHHLCNLTVFKAQSGDFEREGSHSPVSPIIGTPVAPVVLLGSVGHSEEPKPGTWHWPERTPDA